MSKAVLVMDMPESCHECPLFSGVYTDMTCRANGNGIDYPYPDKNRPDWCPLKPMPEKSDVDGLPFRDGYKLGWNACIDKILGEGETD